MVTKKHKMNDELKLQNSLRSRIKKKLEDAINIKNEVEPEHKRLNTFFKSLFCETARNKTVA